MKSHLQNAVNFRQTSQSMPAKPNQVKNNAGGFTFKASDLEIVKRFLILGTEGGSYYASQRKLTADMVNSSINTIRTNGIDVVNLIVDISTSGRAVKNSGALFLLAAAAGQGDLQTRRAALNALPKVARTATHLFEFLEYTKQFRGWGRALKSAVANWYEAKDADALAYQMVKYRSREGWTHRDVLRKAHPSTDEACHAALYDWACHDKSNEHLPSIVYGFQKAIKVASPAEAVSVLKAYRNLPWETLNTAVLKDASVWKQLLPTLPLTALVRNLGRMTANGALSPFSREVDLVVEKLGSSEYLQKARVHPVSLYVAKATYQSGRGDKGSLSWTPIPQVVKALEDAFYKAFQFVEPTGKRFLLGLDVSGSMSGAKCSGMNISAREASAVMALTTLKSERNVITMAFSGGFIPLSLSANDNMDSALHKVSRLPFDNTDCALPMLYAMKHKIPVDTFVIYTDSETWFGSEHPHQALSHYRGVSGIPAKLVVVSMVANPFTIADPSDKGMLDVVGFDTSTPAAISEFSKL